MIFLLTVTALAERPDEGGLFSFSSADVISVYDTDNFRVHFSIEGPSQTIMEDSDASDIPDFVEYVAETAEDVLTLYQDAGFLSPLTEAELGVVLGGSLVFRNAV